MTQTSILPLEQAVTTEESFAYFDLGFDENTKELLANLSVNQKAEYDNFGAKELLIVDAERFLISLGNTAVISAKMAQIISQTTSNILSAFKAETGWVTLRASVATDEYDLPRWHADGYYYPPYKRDQNKAALSLKGAATLFSRCPREAFSVLDRNYDMDEMEKRLKIAELVSMTPIESVPAGHGVVFTVGSERAAIHSEPPIHIERLFMSVVPGTASQIEDLRQDWKAKTTTYSLE